MTRFRFLLIVLISTTILAYVICSESDYEFDEAPNEAIDYGLFGKNKKGGKKGMKECNKKAKKMNKKLGYTCEANDGDSKCDASEGAGVKQDLCMWKKNKCKCSKQWCRPTDAAPAKVSAR